LVWNGTARPLLVAKEVVDWELRASDLKTELELIELKKRLEELGATTKIVPGKVDYILSDEEPQNDRDS